MHRVLSGIIGAVLVGTSVLAGTGEWISKVDNFTPSHGLQSKVASDMNGNGYLAINQPLWGSSKVYVVKNGPEGEWLWRTTIKGATANALQVDSAGQIFLSGELYSGAQFGETSLPNEEGNNVYVARLNSDGLFQSAFRLGGTGYVIRPLLALTDSDDLIIAGTSYHTVSFGTNSFVSAAQGSAFIARYSKAGELRWVRAIHPTGRHSYATTESVGVDQDGNAWVAGHFRGSYMQLEQKVIYSYTAQTGFLAKYSPEGDL
ncbi:MAG: hypothetical protein ACK4UN_19040, partial [Limisphaerales bacterium]